MPFTFQPALNLGALLAPQTFLLTAASYSHSTSSAVQLFPFSFFFLLLCVRGFLPSIAWPRQNMEALERVASHVKVTFPPCLFRLPPWENVNRSTTLIYSM